MIQLANETLIELRDLFTHHPLFLIGLLLLVGYMIGKLAARFRLPEISGFILAGLLVNSFTTGIVSHEMNDSLHTVTEVAIGFLALTIGSEFSVRKMRRIGRDVATITAVNLLGTFALVLVGCLALDLLFDSFAIGYPYAILLAVIACATSPAVIVAEVHHMRAHGRFIDYLFGVVALGDAVTVVVFGLAFTLVINILGATNSHSLFLKSVLEIVFSLACGLLCAIPLHVMARRIRNHAELMIVSIGFIFVVTGFSLVLHLSPLLVNMAIGATLVNLAGNNTRIFRAIEPFTPPIYALFFVIAGLEINPAVFLSGTAMAVSLAYMLLRGAGKCWSAHLACRMRGIEEAIGRNLGYCMLSKGGVALGFVLLIQTSAALDSLRHDSRISGIFSGLVSIVLISIFVNELASPFFLRRAVLKGNRME